VEKALGALPVVAEFCRRLDVAGIVDRACPVRDIAYATHGQVIEALVANRLTSPTPLVHVEDWARAWAVEEVLCLPPEVLNDDRTGRALDAVAPELDGIVGSVGTMAIAEFGIQVARIHWDMTSISLFGAYASPDEDYIEPRFGHPKDRRPGLLQVQAGLAVSADGGKTFKHPVYHSEPSSFSCDVAAAANDAGDAYVAGEDIRRAPGLVRRHAGPPAGDGVATLSELPDYSN